MERGRGTKSVYRHARSEADETTGKDGESDSEFQLIHLRV